MSIVTDLLIRPGVIAAGEYTYKQELSYYNGNITLEQARLLAIMCYSTTKELVMEGDMVAILNPREERRPPRAWVLRGPQRTLCVVANVFCLFDNSKGSFNKIFGFMRQALANETLDLV